MLWQILSTVPYATIVEFLAQYCVQLSSNPKHCFVCTYSQVSITVWGCRIHQLLLLRGVTPTQECPTASPQRDNTNPPRCVLHMTQKKTDGDIPVMLEHWKMRCIPSLPSLPGPLRPGVIAPDRVLSMDQIELNLILLLNWISWNGTVLTFKLHTYVKLNCLK